MRQRSGAGSSKPRRRKAPAAKRRGRVETIRGVTSSASREELRFALLRRELSEARRHQRRAEEALRESEQQLHQIIDTVPSFLWSADPTGEPTYVNQRALDYSGMRFEEFKHGGWEAFIHPADFPGTIKAFSHAIETGTPYETVHRLRRWDGGYRWHQARGDPLRDRDGLIIKWFGVAVDIDDAKKAENRLRRSEAYLSEAQRLTHTATVAYNATEILYFSDEAFGLFGFDPLQGLPSREAVWRRTHPGDVDRVNEKIGHALREKRSLQNEFRLKLPDGTVKHVDADILPVFSATGELVEIIATAVDVTERKRTEDTVRRGEAWLAQAQRLSHTGTWVLDGTTKRFLYWSDESYRIWGFDPLKGLPTRDAMWERIHPDDRERVWAEVQEALREQRDFFDEFRILLPDGTVKYLESNTHHEFSPLGALFEVVSTSVDITERKHAEQALRESERRHRQLIESVPCHFWSANPNGEPTYVNQRLLDYFGIQFEDRKRDMKVLHPDDVAETERALSHAFRTGESFQRVHRLRRADGEYRWHRVRAEPQRDPSGNIIQWYGFSIDIDEVKKAEDVLRESEQSLRSAIDGIAGLIAILAANGELETVNRQITEYFGWPAEELKNWETSDAVHPEDLPRVLELYTRSIAGGNPFQFELRLRRFDGEYRWFENRGVPIRDNSGRILRWYILLVDVEDRTRALERLQQMQSDFAHMNRVSMMGELAASLSHEILHPIATARNNARAGMRFLEMSPPNLDEARESLGCVVRDADRAKDIVGRIRNQIKKAPPRKECFGLNEAINEVIVMVRSAIADNRVSVQTRLAEGALAIHGDRVQLQQVLLNLILNAVEAMGSVEAGSRELLVSTEQDRTDVLVAVRDSGPGIDATHLERVFEAFYTTKSGGTGMGLLICRSIIDAHGGKLWAEANKPRGAVFQFSLPATQEDS